MNWQEFLQSDDDYLENKIEKIMSNPDLLAQSAWFLAECEGAGVERVQQILADESLLREAVIAELSQEHFYPLEEIEPEAEEDLQSYWDSIHPLTRSQNHSLEM